MIIKIRDGKGSAEIDSLGAQLMSLKNAQGLEYLWQGDSSYWHGRAPVLFPIVGMLKDGKTRIGGKAYAMNRHGFARAMEHEIVSQKEDEVVFRLCADERTLEMYPFRFELETSFSLKDGVLSNRFCIRNRGEDEMPFAVGGHPAFRCPLLPEEAFEDYSVVFPEKETASLPRIDMKTGLIDFENRQPFLQDVSEIRLEHSLFYKDALVFDSLKSHSVRLESRKTGKGLEMDFTGFPMLGIWSAANDAPFVALEPWHGCADAADSDGEFLHKRDLRILSSGNTAESVFTMRML